LLLGVGRRQCRQAVHGRETRRFVGLVGAELDVEQDASRFVAYLPVGLPAHDLCEHRDAPEPAHRRTPHTRVGIRARQLLEFFVLLVREILHAQNANGGICVLPARLRLEAIEKTHAVWLRPRAPGPALACACTGTAARSGAVQSTAGSALTATAIAAASALVPSLLSCAVTGICARARPRAALVVLLSLDGYREVREGG